MTVINTKEFLGPRSSSAYIYLVSAVYCRLCWLQICCQISCLFEVLRVAKFYLIF